VTEGQATQQLRVVVADDSVVVRQGVARILAEGGFRVVAEAADAPGLLDAITEQRPHLAVIDIRMPPGGNAGLAAALTIRERHPTVGVLVLSQYLEPEYALRLLGSGVDRVGYLLKDRLGTADELIDAATRVAAGGSAVDPAVVSELVHAHRRDDRLIRLTEREREALSLIAEGRSNRSIAERLGITTKTLEGMTGTIFSKLGIEDDPDLNRRVVAVLLFLRGPIAPTTRT
jgi:DNA-binding NarL/FixJ family response regulator